MKSRRSLVALFVMLAASGSGAQTPGAAPVSTAAWRGLPLPAAKIRLAIADVDAFDRALSGGFRRALTGELAPDDGVASGFRQSQVGAKLVDQWGRFTGETAISFKTITALETHSLALAVLGIGDLEMVLALETKASALPELFEEGTARTASGRTYHLVRSGAADEGAGGETRMGLAWARDGGVLFVATSERAMKLALEAAAADRRFMPKLEGLASLELDADLLREDLYFKRDFFWNGISDVDTASGRIHAALRLESNRLVEVREGAVAAGVPTRGVVFEAPGSLASGWIDDGLRAASELWRAVLDPIPSSSMRPDVASGALPSTKAASAEDRYATSVETPLLEGTSLTDTAERDRWQALFTAHKPAGFGYVTTRTRARLLVLPWPKEGDAELMSLIESRLTHRGARLVRGDASGETREFAFGPNLPALAVRRAGEFVWFGPSAADLRAVPVPRWSDDVSRFAKLSLVAARNERRRWERVEGPRSPDSARPFADRVLGLLGWMPSVRLLEVERRVSGSAFRERIVFSQAPPASSAAPSPPPTASR